MADDVAERIRVALAEIMEAETALKKEIGLNSIKLGRLQGGMAVLVAVVLALLAAVLSQ